MKKHYRKEQDCANCGTQLEGKFCHNCGQENLELKENFVHMMNHAISDYFHFDHQFFHTIKPLFFEPGKLTNEYMAGRRMQYLHPVKMYIFISLVYFVLVFKSNEQVRVSEQANNIEITTRDRHPTINKIIAKDTNVTSYVKPFIEGTKKNKETISADSIVESLAEAAKDKSSRLPGATRAASYPEYLQQQSKLPVKERDIALLRAYNEKNFIYREKYGNRARDVFFEDIKHNIPKMMFLMLPLCALIFKITFWRNKKYYVEHLIFTFHLHSFIFLYLAIIMFIQLLTPESWDAVDDWLDLASFVGVCWYLYRALRVFYQRSRWRTISKIIGSGTMYFITFSLCMLLLFSIMAFL